MASLTDLSDIVNRVTGGNNGTPENIFFFKDGRVAGAAAVSTVTGRITSLWQYAGIPSHGVVPGAVSIPNNTTAGGLRQLNPGAGRQKWLLGTTATATSSGTLLFFDRLLHNGGLSATVITAQTVGGTLTRNVNGNGNQIWVEIYSIIGTTATTIRASYTNQAGVSGQITELTAFGGTGLREAQRLIQLPLAEGDTGVRSVQSVTVTATTGAAGNFGVVILKPITNIQIGITAVGSVRDLISGLPSIMEIESGACLSMAWFATAATTPQFFGSLHMIEK
jgi:hypothetical protein